MFPNIGFSDFFAGLWFDWITLCMVFIPYFFFFLLPLPIRGYKAHAVAFKSLFHLINGLVLSINLIDVEYFRFTRKRSTADVFGIISGENEMGTLILSFLKDFWYLLLVFIIFTALAEWLYRKTEKPFEKWHERSHGFFLTNSLSFVVLIAVFMVSGRGGFRVRPIGVMEASIYTSVENTPLVLNTAFTMLKSFGKKTLGLKNYMPESESERLFSPIKRSNPQNILPDGTNVMLVVLESFGNELVGFKGGADGYTPFLDSLSKESLTFEHSFANGKKSIEAVPSIIASIPSLMDNPYINSTYSSNNIRSLADILSEKGYETAFFHGATNGSMRFDAFTAQTGFKKYFGRNEYGNEAHTDGTWGILDEYFNPWTAKEISKMKPPFFATLFTVSSHHPFFIPERLKPKFKTGRIPIYASVAYADYSLKLFFEEAKKQPWYKNTLFVLCADHTPYSGDAFYEQKTQMYQVPIMFYHPEKSLKPTKEKKIFQQLDILPTVLDLTNINTPFYSFGNSAYSDAEGEALVYIEGAYYYFSKDKMLVFSNDKTQNLYNFTGRIQVTEDSLAFYKDESAKAEKKLKAIIQRYHKDLVGNKTVAE